MTIKEINKPENLVNTAKKAEDSSFWALLRLRNFRLLWGAGFLSAIGDQVDLITFPWLVLLITSDPLAVGAIIAVGGIPAVFFMLIGGSLVDRFSPRLIIQVSNLTRIMLGGLLAVFILTGWTNLWVLYIFALIKGIADSFYYPAQAAMLPSIVPDKQLLRQANAITQTTVQISGFVGPTLAGALIVLFGNTSQITSPDGIVASPSLIGVALAFVILAVVFLVSFILIALMRLNQSEQPAANEELVEKKEDSVFSSIVEGLRFVRADGAMFTIFILVAGMELFIQGPIIVGTPILAHTRLPEGALAVGLFWSAYAGAALLGALLAGILPAPKNHLGPIFMTFFGLTALFVTPFGFLRETWILVGAAAGQGITDGYIKVLFITWIQARTPEVMMGRVMSLLLAAELGLVPISNAATGALIKISLDGVFIGGGALMALLSLIGGFRREIRDLRMIYSQD